MATSRITNQSSTSAGKKPASTRGSSVTDRVKKRVIDELIAEVDSLKAEKVEFKKQINKLSQEANQIRQKEDLIVETVEQIWKTPPNLVVPRPPKFERRKEEEIAFLHLSDTQIGKVTSSYNSQVAADRCMLLAEKTARITEMRRARANIRKLVIGWGGDMVEGDCIFPGQAWVVDSGGAEQASYSAPSILWRMTMYLLGQFEEIEIRAVPGNHGRVAPKGTGVHFNSNWDRVCYRVAQLMLMGPDENPRPEMKGRLKVDISPTFYDVSYAFDWGMLMVHGDQIRGGFAGFPWYGAAKKAWGWIDSIPQAWDYLFFGHFHTYASGVLNHRTFLANGTTESDNEYAQEQLSACGYPCQRLAFFDPKHGLIADNQIFLDDSRQPQRARVGSR